MSLTVPVPGSASNILIGAQKMYVAPYGSALPTISPEADNGVTFLTMSNPWAYIGFTNAGQTFDYQPVLKEIMVDEALSAVTVIKTGESLKISAALSEATLENLNLAISGAGFTQVAAGPTPAYESAKLTVGGSIAFNYYTILFVGVGMTGAPRLVQAYKVYSTAKVSLAFKKDTEIMVPVEFTGLADTTRAVGDQLFQMLEKRANATT